ncbi:hypothetical protein [Streptomyces sp. NPDC023838]|uniref:hypothetical protein n=1 Tax=Streptomyces sp. NPDC023838 TaxID=3154325 RepID=UPI0033CBB158
MAAGIRPGTRRPTGPETTGTSRPPLVRELLLVTALFVVYKFGRQLVNGHETRAVAPEPARAPDSALISGRTGVPRSAGPAADSADAPRLAELLR